MLGKGMARVLGLMEQTGNFFLLFRMTCEFKAMKCLLLELSISFVETCLIIDNCNYKSRTVAKGLLGFSLANNRVP